MASGANETVCLNTQSAFGAFSTSPVWTPIPRVTVKSGVNMPEILDPTIMTNAQIHESLLGVETSPIELATVARWGAFDVLWADVVRGTWSTDVLVPGILAPLISIERKSTDVTDKAYIRHRDCVVNKMALSGKVDANVDITWSLLGITLSTSNAILDGATYAAESAYKAFSTKTAVLSMDSTPVGWASGWSLDIDNGCDYRKVTGAATSLQQAYGAMGITGSIDGFYETAAMLDAFKAGATHALTLVLTDEEANTHTITLPRIRFNGEAGPSSGGPGASTQALKFRATYDTSAEYSIQIER